MIAAAVITVSDSSFAGAREDISGPAVRKRCEEFGWSVQHTQIVADDETRIAAALQDCIDRAIADVILTTGGTGIASRDVTPEATRRIISREIPGVAELMRSEGLKKTQYAVLSRGVVGVAGSTLIINLPGSPKGAVESLASVAGLIPHIVDLLNGRTGHDPS